ncbi:hypothetical protein DFJ73DRAFT_856659 [Zopfochytrium polystomum]|nr:hypothetical protein DFJ73DRAFT_856659 [Zopfochytrium polystomum]
MLLWVCELLRHVILAEDRFQMRVKTNHGTQSIRRLAHGPATSATRTIAQQTLGMTLPDRRSRAPSGQLRPGEESGWAANQTTDRLSAPRQELSSKRVAASTRPGSNRLETSQLNRSSSFAGPSRQDRGPNVLLTHSSKEISHSIHFASASSSQAKPISMHDSAQTARKDTQSDRFRGTSTLPTPGSKLKGPSTASRVHQSLNPIHSIPQSTTHAVASAAEPLVLTVPARPVSTRHAVAGDSPGYLRTTAARREAERDRFVTHTATNSQRVLLPRPVFSRATITGSEELRSGQAKSEQSIAHGGHTLASRTNQTSTSQISSRGVTSNTAEQRYARVHEDRPPHSRLHVERGMSESTPILVSRQSARILPGARSSEQLARSGSSASGVARAPRPRQPARSNEEVDYDAILAFQLQQEELDLIQKEVSDLEFAQLHAGTSEIEMRGSNAAQVRQAREEARHIFQRDIRQREAASEIVMPDWIPSPDEFLPGVQANDAEQEAAAVYESLISLAEELGPAASTGASEAHLVQMPTVPFAAGTRIEDRACAICLDRFVEGEEVVIVPGCGHRFHWDACGLTWFRSSKKCPTCRADFTEALAMPIE